MCYEKDRMPPRKGRKAQRQKKVPEVEEREGPTGPSKIRESYPSGKSKRVPYKQTRAEEAKHRYDCQQTGSGDKHDKYRGARAGHHRLERGRRMTAGKESDGAKRDVQEGKSKITNRRTVVKSIMGEGAAGANTRN